MTWHQGNFWGAFIFLCFHSAFCISSDMLDWRASGINALVEQVTDVKISWKWPLAILFKVCLCKIGWHTDKFNLTSPNLHEIDVGIALKIKESDQRSKGWREKNSLHFARVAKPPSARQQCWPESFCKSGWFEKCPDDLQSIGMIWRVSGWSESVWMIWKGLYFVDTYFKSMNSNYFFYWYWYWNCCLTHFCCKFDNAI